MVSVVANMEDSLPQGSIKSRFLLGGNHGMQSSFACLEQLLKSSFNLPKWESDSCLSQVGTMASPSCLVEEDPSTRDEVLAAKPKGKRKRKLTKPAKNNEEVESQRMTHVAVERNRRRQMNNHLHVLRSLLPPPYIHRGDQASIIGGAIEFVKQLEQLIRSLEIQNTMKALDVDEGGEQPSLAASSTSTDSSRATRVRKSTWCNAEGVRVIDGHVNVKVECEWRPRLLLNAIAQLEEMRLSVLHLNITSSSSSLFFLSFNLKIEDGCEVRSANEIAEAVENIFNKFLG